ncbi:MAG: LysE family translocator [Hyphomicrobiales bacterium]|nr:LysE family translocator [Hyphomicrobiales bacterium]
MSYEILTALAAFALVTSITPGPNNLMVMASSANFGIVRTIPHLLGISIGFSLMTILVGAGLSQIFELHPGAYTALKFVGVIYMAYLAWKIATAAPGGKTGQSGKPLTFLEAALFQWVNPKAWAMALTAISLYADDQTLTAIAVVALVFAAVNLPSVGLWLFLGQQMSRLLTNAGRLRIFNIVMAALLIASLYPILHA